MRTLTEQVRAFGTKFKIPTLLGLGVVIAGIAVGVFLVLREQTFFTQAAPSQTPQNITVSNIEDSSVTISWQTSSSVTGFVTFGQSGAVEATILDDRDTKIPEPHLIHYVTIKNLLPKTTYQYKIASGKIVTKVSNFTTASPINTQNAFGPVIGSILDSGKPLNEGIVYLSLSGAIIQSSLVKNLGNFLIPLTRVRKEDLSDILPLEEQMNAKITIVSPNNQSSAVFNLKPEGENLPPIKLGESVDLTNLTSPTPNPSPIPIVYDLNNDGKINAADYSIAQKNKGKKINGVLIDDKYLKELTNMVNSLNPG